MVRVFDICMKEWVVLPEHKKEVLCVLSYSFMPKTVRPDASLTPALVWHPVHRILASGNSEGTVLHCDLFSLTAGTPPRIFLSTPLPSTTTATTSPAHHTTPVRPAPARQISPHATPCQTHDLNICGLMLHPLHHLLVSGSDDRMITSGCVSDLAMHPLFLPQVAPRLREPGSAGRSETSRTTYVVRTAE
jgi:hypothetical protein